MSTPINTTTVAPGVNYLNHPAHRNGSPLKSQWTISGLDELTIFINARNNDWGLPNISWGLHIPNRAVKYLGVSSDGRRQLLIGKFIDGSASGNWHGYPADHQQNNSDIPDLSILKTWINNGLLRRPKVRKILKGQPCNL